MARYNGRASYKQVWDLALVLLRKPKSGFETLREAMAEAVRQIEDALDDDGSFTLTVDGSGPNPEDHDSRTYVVTRDDGLMIGEDEDEDEDEDEESGSDPDSDELDPHDPEHRTA